MITTSTNSAPRSQNYKVFKYLTGAKGRTLTARQARSRFGVKNLSARISDLRDYGLNVVTEMRETRTSTQPVAFYSIG